MPTAEADCCPDAADSSDYFIPVIAVLYMQQEGAGSWVSVPRYHYLEGGHPY